MSMAVWSCYLAVYKECGKEAENMLADIIAIVLLTLALFFACRHIYREKKKGTMCIGCPQAGTCLNKESCNRKEKA